MDHDRVWEAEEKRLCIICGLELTEDFVYSNFDGEPHDSFDRREDVYYDSDRGGFVSVIRGAPSATFVHPRCALQAAAFCPHLKQQEYPALDQQGKPLTLDDLRKLSNVHKEP